MVHRYSPTHNIDFSELHSVRLGVASCDDILSWSHGEVLKSETINYRTQKPEKDGLFCEKIFGPVKDINPHDSRFKGARSRNIAVDKKGAIVTKSIVRRERMGHIALAVPVAHIWFLRVAPSPLSCITGLTIKALEKVIYFNSYLILDVNDKKQDKLKTVLEKTYQKLVVALEKPQSTDRLISGLFNYFMNEANHKLAQVEEVDVFATLMEVDKYYADNEELLNNIADHQLLDAGQLDHLSDSLINLAGVFAKSKLIYKQADVFKIYEQYAAAKTPPKDMDLDDKLKAEFKSIYKAMDQFIHHLSFKLDKLEKLYHLRRHQLQELITYKGVISELEYRGLPAAYRQLIKIGMGAESLRELLEGINLDQLIVDLEEEVDVSKGQKRIVLLKRLKILQGMKKAGVKIEDFCLTVLPVIPPNLRPIIQLSGGRFATSDLNDLYRRVINRNNRLKKLQELNAPEVICRNEKRMIQEAVDALIDNSQQRGGRVATGGSQQRKLKSLADILKRKQGRLRQNTLGKRVDYSGRSVIVAGSKLNILECGLPKYMALELFKPFVIGYLIAHEHANNIPSAKRLIETEENIIWNALDQVIQDKFILLNRAPSLHRLSIQAFKPKLIEGKAIQLHPLVCKGFNADFDGDTMAVHLPLSKMAQAEAEKFMTVTNNLLHPADGTPILYLDQDIIMGLYYLTHIPKDQTKIKHYFASIAEAIYAYENDRIKIQTMIDVYFRGQRRQTSFGRIILNEIFPDDFPFQDRDLTKTNIKDMMSIVYRMYDNETVVKVADNLKNLALEYATKSGLSIGMGDFMTAQGHEELQKRGIQRVIDIDRYWAQGYLTRRERLDLIINTWRKINGQIQDLVTEQFAQVDNFLSLVVDSAARGIQLSDIKSMSVAVGQMQDATGKPIELPVNGNYVSGLPSVEYFVAARGSRKSLIDVALSTAESGYLTRKLVYVAQSSITIEDSDEYVDEGFEIFKSESEIMNVKFATRLVNRYAAEDIILDGQVIIARGQLITPEAAKQIEDSSIESVKIMSVLSTSCLVGIPIKSYGIDLANGQLVDVNQPVGIVAAQSIGEPSTQLKLDSKHGGGLASSTQRLVSTGFNRAEELFEARAPKGLSYLAPFSGKIRLKELNYDYEINITASADSLFEIDVSSCQLQVEVNDAVAEAGLLAYDENCEAILAPTAATVVKLDKDKIYLKPNNTLETRFLISKEFDINVEDGQIVQAGDSLNEGSLKLDELLRLKGKEATQRYILIEISRIFASQGSHVADKHLEIIIRQMFSRVKIVDAGDSQFIEGDVVSQIVLVEANAELIADGKKPAVWQQLVMGITKINSLSDSFLVAASFQDTTRVLVGSAIQGKVDNLDGLIENVILGRKIPVGTGISHDKIKTDL